MEKIHDHGYLSIFNNTEYMHGIKLMYRPVENFTKSIHINFLLRVHVISDFGDYKESIKNQLFGEEPNLVLHNILQISIPIGQHIVTTKSDQYHLFDLYFLLWRLEKIGTI